MKDFSPWSRCLIDLHLHLDGSISVKTAKELAKLEGIKLPDSDESVRKLLMVSDSCQDLNEYLEKFSLPVSLLQSEESLELCTCRLCEELQEKGLIYAEIRFAPQKHCDKGLSMEQAVCAAICGMERSLFHAQLILCCMRDGADNSAQNLETIELTKKYLGKGVCACDLAGAEALYPNEKYAHLFEHARRLEVPFTIHAGEALGAESVAMALDYGASRIGHGIRSFEDPAVVRRLAEHQIPIEVCPTSNINTCVYPNICSIPIMKLQEQGVIVTINSDNMSVSNTTVQKELERTAEAFHLQEQEIKTFLLNSAKASFLPEDAKAGLIQQINAART